MQFDIPRRRTSACSDGIQDTFPRPRTTASWRAQDVSGVTIRSDGTTDRSAPLIEDDQRETTTARAVLGITRMGCGGQDRRAVVATDECVATSLSVADAVASAGPGGGAGGPTDCTERRLRGDGDDRDHGRPPFGAGQEQQLAVSGTVVRDV
jgi:hypothetical protein